MFQILIMAATDNFSDWDLSEEDYIKILQKCENEQKSDTEKDHERANNDIIVLDKEF